jgi:hypothetical protein
MAKVGTATQLITTVEHTFPLDMTASLWSSLNCLTLSRRTNNALRDVCAARGLRLGNSRSLAEHQREQRARRALPAEKIPYGLTGSAGSQPEA